MKIIKNIFEICKKDVFYTLFFVTTAYTCVHLFYLIIFDNSVYSYGEYHPEFIINKWLIFISSLFSVYKVYKENNKSNVLFIFGAISVIFNTVFKIPFDESQWFWVLCFTALIFIHFSIILFFSGENEHKCSVCDNKPFFTKLYRVRIFKGGFNTGEIHFDGETYICSACYSKCKKCSHCNKAILTDDIKKSLGNWETTDFCTCDKKE